MRLRRMCPKEEENRCKRWERNFFRTPKKWRKTYGFTSTSSPFPLHVFLPVSIPIGQSLDQCTCPILSAVSQLPIGSMFSSMRCLYGKLLQPCCFPSSIAFILLLVYFSYPSNCQTQMRLPVVYVYTVGIYSCKQGIPAYITTSLEQALLHQPDCDVIMASNYQECSTVEAVIDRIPGVIKYDISTLLGSPRTKEFANLTETMFEANFNGKCIPIYIFCALINLLIKLDTRF